MRKAPTPLTVSQLNLHAKQALEGALPNVWVQGEITNLSKPSSGHWYFTLKDPRAQVRCAMFRGRNILIRTPINAGDKIVVNASVSLYEGRGDYQLIVDSLQKAGLGDLHQQYEALREKLLTEGLFDPVRKRSIPAFPTRIGVISSPTGAAVHDILTVLRRRYPYGEVVIYPALVQGADAPTSLINALRLANDQACCDLLIIGRGGGSLEDLWAFNDERIVRAIAASRTIIISAVGHEVDVTLSDFAADLRAATPSAAAEAATPNQDEIYALLSQYRNRIAHLMRTRVLAARQAAKHLSKRLIHPQASLLRNRQRIDILEERIKKGYLSLLKQQQVRLNNLQKRLQRNNPRHQLRQQNADLTALKSALNNALQRALAKKQQSLKLNVQLLNNLSPLNTLQRGYAITRDNTGTVISQASQLTAGQTINIRYADGDVKASIVANDD